MNTFKHEYTALEKVVSNQSINTAIPELIQQYKNNRILILASHSLSNQTEVIQKLIASLADFTVAVFDQVRAHTPREDVIAAIAKASEIQADVIVAVGGGSIIDAAKAVQLALNLGIDSADDLQQYAQKADGTRGPKAKIAAKGLFDAKNTVRIIAVPTTLSGAEFSNTAGVLDSDNGSKEGYRSPLLYPRVIVYDPEISVHTPEWLWLSTAVRSIDHAVEGFCSPQSYPFLEGQYLHALTLFATSLPAVKKRPGDIEGRSINQQAVWLACCGLGKVSHGASHGIGYILGSLCGVPHGYTSCVMLPAVLIWNARVNGDQQRAIASALGDAHTPAADLLKQLITGLGLPANLQAVNVEKHQLPEIAERAAQHPVVKSNPRPIQSAAEVLEILELAWD